MIVKIVIACVIIAAILLITNYFWHKENKE